LFQNNRAALTGLIDTLVYENTAGLFFLSTDYKDYKDFIGVMVEDGDELVGIKKCDFGEVGFKGALRCAYRAYRYPRWRGFVIRAFAIPLAFKPRLEFATTSPKIKITQYSYYHKNKFISQTSCKSL